MLDFRVSSHAHFDEACRKFAATHNVKELANKAGIKPHTLYNKLNPEQPHQLTPREIWTLTDLTEDLNKQANELLGTAGKLTDKLQGMFGG
ncbi:phage regulatory CII family protein, partial [Citrobacter freundii]|uniref:phage regulatory CII family protein n=1 Tax=Citrobacter freundii TaxID=546 RepID=UPI003A969AF7